MVYSYVFDLKILFKKFYCPICGEKLKVVKEVTMLDQEQKELYYKKRSGHGMRMPIKLDVCKVEQMFNCPNCNYYNTTRNQLSIRKKQKLLKKTILNESDYL